MLAIAEQETVRLVTAQVKGTNRHLLGMWVDPAARGTGAATAVVGAVSAWAATGGAATVSL